MSKYEDLEERIARLEKALKSGGGGSGAGGGGETPQLCCAPPQLPPRQFDADVSVERARLLINRGKKWVNGTILHYYFFENSSWDASDAEKDIVREAFDVWKEVGIGLEFQEVTSADDAEIRIGFQNGDGYWSYIGTDVLRIGQSERTMNFGQDLRNDSRGVDVPVHEIGHTLGFPHEHQNPFSGIVWDRQAVIDRFSRPPNGWSVAMIEHNILNKHDASVVDGSDWDPDSIMHYAFPPGLIESPPPYDTQGLHPAPGLSDTDKAQVLEFYAPMRPTHPELKPFALERLSLVPNEQANFTISPTSTREYTIQTFGRTDTLIVLFEDLGNGNYQYVDGDDDSGWNRNAKLQLRMYANRKYVLRIRLYYQWSSGDTAVLLT